MEIINTSELIIIEEISVDFTNPDMGGSIICVFIIMAVITAISGGVIVIAVSRRLKNSMK